MTADFLAAHVPAGGTIVEVGCGEGEVAAELQSRGFRVVAVDADEDMVRAARIRGVSAIRGEWPHVAVPHADAVAFTRSLHHVHELDAAIDAAAACAPLLLVEDFDVHAINEYAVEQLLGMRFEEWRAEHEHVHAVATMLAAIERRFAIVETAEVPYLYRYADVSLLEREREEAAAGRIRLAGRRWVATHALGLHAPGVVA